jgi:hypothetical protein
MRIDCSEVRRRLWPADVLRVSDAEVEAALEHAERCPACQSFLEEDRHIAQMVRDHVPRVRAPRQLRERLYTVLARERAGSATANVARGGKSRSRVAMAALVLAGGLVIGAVGQHLASRRVGASPAQEFAEDYLRRVVEEEELRTADRQEIASFFARELGVSMPPPDVRDFQVERATICLMNGRRGGVVEYSGQGRRLTYYLLPYVEGAAAEPARVADGGVARATFGTPALAEERGLGVATWWDDKHQHALVGDFSAQELRRLAPLFACPAPPI